MLKLSLRSDYPRLLRGEEMRERVEALTALAEGGKLDDSYVAELARQADFLPNVSVAEMTARRRGQLAATRASSPRCSKRCGAG